MEMSVAVEDGVAETKAGRHPNAREVEQEEEEDWDKADEKTPFLDSSVSSSNPGPTSPFTGKRVRFSMEEFPIDKEEMYGLVPPTFMRRVFVLLYGSAPTVELMPMIASLSAILCTIIGGFWLLDSLKDTIFATIVGMEYQPWAKFCSVIFTLGLTLVYNSLVDHVQKPTLFYIVGGSYFFVFTLLATLLAEPSLGMRNKEASPDRLLGWASYLAIESYGSLACAMFWAFTNSVVHLEGAKSVYGLILAGAQVGAIIGSTLATEARYMRVPTLYAMGAVTPLVMALLIYRYKRKFSKHLPAESPRSAKPKTHEKRVAGLTDGLRTLFKYPYVMSLAAISCLYEVVITILDYEMKVVGLQRVRGRRHASEDFAALMGHFGQLTNGLSFAFSLFGTSYVVRKLGLPRTLRIFPTLLILASVTASVVPRLEVLFFFVSILKALSYALNEPCKEMLYIPTTDLIRFKAKSWIDVFGNRTAKAFGSLITGFARDDPDALVKIGSAPSWIVSMILVFISMYMGREFEDLIKSGEVIGENELYSTGVLRGDMLSLSSSGGHNKPDAPPHPLTSRGRSGEEDVRGSEGGGAPT